MPKRVPEEAKRVPLNCLVLPETLQYLKSSNGSQGVAVDMAVAALKMQQTQGRVRINVSELSGRHRDGSGGTALYKTGDSGNASTTGE